MPRPGPTLRQLLQVQACLTSTPLQNSCWRGFSSHCVDARGTPRQPLLDMPQHLCGVGEGGQKESGGSRLQMVGGTQPLACMGDRRPLISRQTAKLGGSWLMTLTGSEGGALYNTCVGVWRGMLLGTLPRGLPSLEGAWLVVGLGEGRGPHGS